MKKRFDPDYASAPGEILSETLAAIGMTQTELARRMCRPIKTINEIVKGKARLTEQTAIGLERELKAPAEFWMALESNYRLMLERRRK